MKAVLILLSLLLADSVYGQVTCPGIYVQIGDRCYSFIDTAHTWFVSNLLCEFSGGYLAQIDSNEEQENLRIYYDLYLDGLKSYWIGATDAATAGSWRWVPDGEAVNFNKWQSGFPTDSLFDNCGYWDPVINVWRNADCCNFNLTAVCERNPM